MGQLTNKVAVVLGASTAPGMGSAIQVNDGLTLRRNPIFAEIQASIAAADKPG